MSFEQIGPVGATVETDRVEMWVRTGGNQYVLQFGPWGLGIFSPRGQITGVGTTNARVTRMADRLWRVEAPEGSIGRLWNVNDIERPVDRGLYYFSFSVDIERS